MERGQARLRGRRTGWFSLPHGLLSRRSDGRRLSKKRAGGDYNPAGEGLLAFSTLHERSKRLPHQRPTPSIKPPHAHLPVQYFEAKKSLRRFATQADWSLDGLTANRCSNETKSHSTGPRRKFPSPRPAHLSWTGIEITIPPNLCAYSEQGLMEGYNVIVLPRCGGSFADGHPSRKFSIVIIGTCRNLHRRRRTDRSTRWTRKGFAKSWTGSPHVPLEQHITTLAARWADCSPNSSGAAYQNLTGFDPSPGLAVETARRLYKHEGEAIARSGISTRS